MSQVVVHVDSPEISIEADEATVTVEANEPVWQIQVLNEDAVSLTAPPDERIYIETDERQVAIFVSNVGPPGPRQLFIGPAAPPTTVTTGHDYIWIQTGLGVDGTGFTIWFEDVD